MALPLSNLPVFRQTTGTNNEAATGQQEDWSTRLRLAAVVLVLTTLGDSRSGRYRAVAWRYDELIRKRGGWFLPRREW